MAFDVKFTATYDRQKYSSKVPKKKKKAWLFAQLFWFLPMPKLFIFLRYWSNFLNIIFLIGLPYYCQPINLLHHHHHLSHKFLKKYNIFCVCNIFSFKYIYIYIYYWYKRVLAILEFCRILLSLYRVDTICLQDWQVLLTKDLVIFSSNCLFIVFLVAPISLKMN